MEKEIQENNIHREKYDNIVLRNRVCMDTAICSVMSAGSILDSNSDSDPN